MGGFAGLGVVGQIGVAAAKTLGGSIAVGAISGAAAGFVGAGLSFGKNWEPQFDMDKAFTGAAIGAAVGGAFAAAGYGIGKGIGAIRRGLAITEQNRYSNVLWAGGKGGPPVSHKRYPLSGSLGRSKSADRGGALTYERQFEGVKVYSSDVGEIGKGAAATPYPFGIIVNKKDINNVNVLRHELGHVLQGRRYGLANFWLNIVPVSLVSPANSHMRTWTESEANTLSYVYFGYPLNWDHKNYPINQQYLDAIFFKTSNIHDK